MKKIGVLSDTHGTFDDPLRRFFDDVDEIWHAGDFGNIETADQIAAFKPLKGVYGNIDGGTTRLAFKQWQQIDCEGITALITHIGGYPRRYEAGVEEYLKRLRPNIFVCGHSHILKVMYDKNLNVLHINPGAAGINGFHQVRTAVRFNINGDKIENMEVGEWAKRL